VWRGVKFWPFPLTLIVVLTTLSHYRASVWYICQILISRIPRIAPLFNIPWPLSLNVRPHTFTSCYKAHIYRILTIYELFLLGSKPNIGFTLRRVLAFLNPSGRHNSAMVTDRRKFTIKWRRHALIHRIATEMELSGYFWQDARNNKPHRCSDECMIARVLTDCTVS